MIKKKINDILLGMQSGSIDIGEASNQLEQLANSTTNFPHESEIDNALDKLLIFRGEHPTRVRNPIYGEERRLARDLLIYMLLRK